MSPALAGFALGFSLILAIGAQNAFVLRQGLRGEHVFAVSLFCAVSDAILIAAGVAGFAMLRDHSPWFEPAMRYGGAVFLIAYGLRSLHSALRGGGAMQPAAEGATSIGRALAVCAAFTWLNPHVYLDTVALVGAVASQSENPLHFGAGAMTASFVFFFSLGYGARLLRPVFASPASWRALDAVVGLVMLALAVMLILPD